MLRNWETLLRLRNITESSKCKRSTLRSQCWMRLFPVIFKHCVGWLIKYSLFSMFLFYDVAIGGEEGLSPLCHKSKGLKAKVECVVTKERKRRSWESISIIEWQKNGNRGLRKGNVQFPFCILKGLERMHGEQLLLYYSRVPI